MHTKSSNRKRNKPEGVGVGLAGAGTDPVIL